MRSVVVAVALLCGVARADTPEQHEHKRNVATALSGIGVGVSAAVTLTAFLTDEGGIVNRPLLGIGLGTSLVTPSLGEWYAGQYLTWGMALRAAAGGLIVLGVTRTEDVRCDSGGPTATCTQLQSSAIPILGLAALVYVGGAAFDVIDAPEAVDRHDRGVVMFSPLMMRGGGGVGLVGRF